MKILNAPIEKFIQYIDDKDVYIYGLGDVFQQLIEKDIYEKINRSVIGYIDNGKAGQSLIINGRQHIIHGVEYLKSVKSGIVLLCSTKKIDDMYKTLCGQDLPDSLECFVLPLIWAVSDGRDDTAIKKLLDESGVKGGESRAEIGKKIHCFWFSGDKKPEKYQKCVDSWKRVCPDYSIVEWNAENYDYEKNVFVKQAFEKRKWAFVSDYARLDVIYNYGGIYLDMDVELLNNFEPLLGFKAFFNFGTQHVIDLGSGFGSVRGNPFIGELLELYNDKEFCNEDGIPMVWKYVQPVFIKDVFRKHGIKLDGSMQLVNDMLILPRRYYTPVDDFLMENYVQTEETRGIHHYNAGWCSAEFMKQRQVEPFWYEVVKRLI